MAHDRGKVEFENDRIRVTRHQTGQRQTGAPGVRNDRLIVYLEDGHVRRTEGGKEEEIRRKAGDVVWRDHSQHQIDVLEDGKHQVLIIELKRA